MELDTLFQENIKLKDENEKLKLENQELITRLKKYTSNEWHHKYYEAHKQEIRKNADNYLENLKQTNPDKIKAYRKTAYENMKKKKLNEIKIKE